MSYIERAKEAQEARERADRTFAAQVSKSDLAVRNAQDYAEYDWGKFLEEEGEDGNKEVDA